MNIYDIIWKEQFVEKLADKHDVSTNEVEEVLFGRPFVRKAKKGNFPGEDLYTAYGQTADGRYLIVIFVYKRNQKAALPISSRDMEQLERRYYEKEKN